MDLAAHYQSTVDEIQFIQNKTMDMFWTSGNIFTVLKSLRPHGHLCASNKVSESSTLPCSMKTIDKDAKVQRKISPLSPEMLEEEITKTMKMFGNKLWIIPQKRILFVNHKTYVKEEDVPVPYDPDASSATLKLLPPREDNCHAPSCRLGCICAAITDCRKSYKKRCSELECMFGCLCRKNAKKENVLIRRIGGVRLTGSDEYSLRSKVIKKIDKLTPVASRKSCGKEMIKRIDKVTPVASRKSCGKEVTRIYNTRYSEKVLKSLNSIVRCKNVKCGKINV